MKQYKLTVENKNGLVIIKNTDIPGTVIPEVVNILNTSIFDKPVLSKNISTVLRRHFKTLDVIRVGIFTE